MPTYNWISPTGDNGQQALWQNGANARDGNTETAASFCNLSLGYSEFLELDFAGGLFCDRVRFFASQQVYNTIDVDVFVPAIGWTHVYAGPYTWDTYIIKSLGTGKFITKARVRFWEQAGANSFLKEFQFNRLKNNSLVGHSLAKGRKGLV